MKTLHLTTPEETGAHVRIAQSLLISNKFGEKFYDGPLDSIFGPITAQACYRAKYWLGYELKECTKVFGDELYGLLTGTVDLSIAMKLRQHERVTAANHTLPLRADAYKEAIRWIGTRENPPNSGEVAFSKWYGFAGEWCAMFVSYCYVEGAKSQSFKADEYYAYVPYIVNDARAGRNNLTIQASPLQGDIVTYDWNHSGIGQHTGLFEKWEDEAAGTFLAVEGNTGNIDRGGGGQVLRQNRTTAEVLCFVRVHK